jgi:hypothetical protein
MDKISTHQQQHQSSVRRCQSWQLIWLESGKYANLKRDKQWLWVAMKIFEFYGNS